MPTPLQIVEIIDRSKQGMTRPFRCRCEKGDLYYVKGAGVDRKSLIAEYLCGQLALSFGLPVPDFAIAEVPLVLIQSGNVDGLNELGTGLVFASKALRHAQEFSLSHLASVPLNLRKDILVFDWWVQNADRTLSERGGNPNLLWDSCNKKLAVIDHNQAFDEQFDAPEFAKSHVFHQTLPAIFDDLVERDHYRQRLESVFSQFEAACNDIPDEWWWVDDGVPANLSREITYTVLARFDDNDFWRIAK